MKDTSSRLARITETACARPADPRPDPEWIRGRCPDCGAVLVSNCYWVEHSHGYAIFWECWSCLCDANLPAEERRCSYRRAL